jgi:hypothetical protein
MSIAIFSILSVGILSFQGVTNAQTSESTPTVPVYGPDSDATQQDCTDIGGTIAVNYEAGKYECILE